MEDTLPDRTHQPDAEPLLKAWRYANGTGLLESRGRRTHAQTARAGTTLMWHWNDGDKLTVVYIDDLGYAYPLSWIPGKTEPDERRLPTFHCTQSP